MASVTAAVTAANRHLPIDFAAPRGHESVHNDKIPIMKRFADV
jgi:hypothetical protein